MTKVIVIVGDREGMVLQTFTVIDDTMSETRMATYIREALANDFDIEEVDPSDLMKKY